MKKLHILLIGATMILASPAMAEDTRDMRSNNDNARQATSTPQASSINYADYTANDDDHGANESYDNIRQVSAPVEETKPAPRNDDKR